MTPQEIFDYYGGKAEAARKCGVSYQAADKWEAKGKVPHGRQALIQIQTGGELVADTDTSRSHSGLIHGQSGSVAKGAL